MTRKNLFYMVTSITIGFIGGCLIIGKKLSPKEDRVSFILTDLPFDTEEEAQTCMKKTVTYIDEHGVKKKYYLHMSNPAKIKSFGGDKN